MPVVIYDGVFGAFNMRQIVGSDYQPNNKAAHYRQSGQTTRSQSVILSGEPVISVESMDLAGFVDSIDPSVGLAITSPGTITVPIRVRAAGGTFVSGGNHYTLSGTLGLLIPVEISGSQDAENGVTIKYEIYVASSTGMSAPVAFNNAQSLGSLAYNASYGFGPVKINGTAIEGVKSWTYKFGHECNKDRYGGGVYPTMSGITIKESNPSIDLTFEDAASAYAFGHFSALNTTASVFARKNASGGTREADGDSLHFSATMTGGIQILQGFSANGTDNGSFTRTIEGHTQAFSKTAAIS